MESKFTKKENKPMKAHEKQAKEKFQLVAKSYKQQMTKTACAFK